MSLTGIPLIALAVLLTTAAGAGTVLLWSRYGRWRLLSRVIGILLTETLVVLTIGLVANRVDMFYPSWAALEGRTGTTVVAAARHAGRLDALVTGRGAVVLPWRPADSATWRLAGPARVVLPAGYRQRRSVTYPAVVSLVDSAAQSAAAVRAARQVTAVGVVVVPTAATTARALTTLRGDIAGDARITDRGWAVVASARQAALADRLIRAAPALFGAFVVVGAAVLPPADRPGGDVALAVVRPTSVRPAPVTANRGVAVLAASAAAEWAVGWTWAAGRTGAPLAAPLQLPAAGHSVLASPSGRARRR